MSQFIKPQQGLLDIQPYLGGEDIFPQGYTRKSLLSSNENPFGASPKAIMAIQDAISNVHLYPSGSSRKLRESLAEHHNIEAARIVCTNGSEEGLTLLIRAFAGHGDEILFSQYAFSLYKIVTQAIGGIPVEAPAANYSIDVDALLNCVSQKTKIVILDNPRNPIGNYLLRDEVLRLRKSLPENILLILDSAYGEYMSRPDYTAGIDLVDQFDNVVMTRTFSKFYGLAGLRLGWMYGPLYLMDYVNRIRPPFCCNSLALSAAKAALTDDEHQQEVLSHQQTMMQWFTDQIKLLDLNFIPSVTNFVTVEFPPEGPYTANAAYLRLAQDGYIVRPLKAYGLPNHLRITLGRLEDMEAVVRILKLLLLKDVALFQYA
jgi:histidinol-phosphate aminotransferase